MIEPKSLISSQQFEEQKISTAADSATKSHANKFPLPPTGPSSDQRLQIEEKQRSSSKLKSFYEKLAEHELSSDESGKQRKLGNEIHFNPEE